MLRNKRYHEFSPNQPQVPQRIGTRGTVGLGLGLGLEVRGTVALGLDWDDVQG